MRRKSQSGAQSKKPRVVQGLRLLQVLLRRFEVFEVAGKRHAKIYTLCIYSLLSKKPTAQS
jgi:hypothetical protein